MSDHAFLAPSSAHIWGPDGCAYYPTMARHYPQDADTLEKREGTAAHHYVTETILDNPVVVPSLAPNGQPITEEMVECGQPLIDDVAKWRGDCAGMFVVEQRVYMPTIHPTENWGTTDIAGVDVLNRILRIRDYKYGHRYVDPYENWQCVDYTIGIARHFGITLDDTWTVEIGVFQPRSYHPDGTRKLWSTSGDRLIELADALAYAARKACEPEPVMHTGDHCNDCEGNIHCPAYQRIVGTAIDISQRGTPHEMNVNAMATMRVLIAEAAQRLKGMGEGLDAQIEALLRGGKPVPGYGLGKTQGKTVWAMPMPEVYALGDMLGVDVRKPDAITPKQAIAALKKAGIEIDEAVIMAYARENTGKTVVVRTAENAAAKAFK